MKSLLLLLLLQAWVLREAVGISTSESSISDIDNHHSRQRRTETETNERDNFIVGGAETTQGPEWMVFPSNNQLPNCGGSLISPDTVITAAHCYDECTNVFFDCETPCPDKVRVGAPTRYDGGIEVDVLPYSCVLHPNFVTEPSNLYDVAVYKLKTPVELSKYATIPDSSFPPYSLSGESGQSGNFQAYGFGRFSNNVISGSEVLREINLTFWYDCNRPGNGDYQAEHHVCAILIEDEGTCQGDSGGPLVYHDTGNNIDYLVGVASFLASDNPNSPCATGLVDYFSRVSSYADWIMQQVDSTAGASSGCSWATQIWEGARRVGLLFQGWL